MHWKQSIISIFFLVLFFSCDKPGPEVEVIPESFEKKVLVETFSGEWCPPCATTYEDYIEPIEKTFDNAIVSISYHIDDDFETSLAKFLATKYEVLGVPQGMTDRYSFGETSTLAIDYFFERIEERLIDESQFGIKISSEVMGFDAGIELDFMARVQLPEAASLHLYLIEDFVPSIAQLGTSDPDHTHRLIYRESISSFDGFDLSGNLVDEKMSFDMTIDVGSYKIQDLYLVAFLESGSEVLQTQIGKLGVNTTW